MLGLELLQQQIPLERKDLQTKIELLKDRFANQIGVPRAVTVSLAINPAIISPLIEAINASKDVEIRYHSLYSDEISVRKIAPLAVIEEDENSYLRAYCRNAKALRVFRVDRILSLSELDVEPNGADTSMDLIDTDGIESEKIPYTIKIKQPTRDLVERFNLDHLFGENPRSQELTVELSSFSREWIQRAVLATGSDVELLSPPELRKEIADRAQLLLERYA
jgi:proteasome accessory factor C